jgi:hypothetical protein
MTLWLALVGGASAGEAQLLILAGAATPEEGQRAFEKAQAALTTWSSIVSPAPGYPQLVDSSTIPGLKPGWYITLLGVCESGQAAPLRDAMATTHAGAYLRAVPWEGEHACPTTTSPLVTSRRATPGGELIGVATVREYLPWGRAALVGSDGAWLLRSELEWRSAIITCDTLHWEKAGDGLALVASCLRPDCTTPSEERGTLRVTASEGKLVQEESWVVLKPGECD